VDDEGQQEVEEFDFVDYCARPMCRKEFRRSAGRGRRRDYCSDTCRRLADRDYKRAKAMVDQFERLAHRSRHDVLAFGRTADEQDPSQIDEDVALERALGALSRAEAIIYFASDADERLIAELRKLCDGVRPLIGQAQSA
jgi:hypothetical protein